MAELEIIQTASNNLAITAQASNNLVIQQGQKGDTGAPGLGLGVAKSIVDNAGNAELSGDSSTPGNNKRYGTNNSGTKGWYEALEIPYVYCRNEQPNNTPAGASVVGTNTRVLNTKVSDTHSIATLASNQVTLPAGTYECRASAPCFAVNRNRLALYNVTDSTYTLLGSSGYADAANSGYWTSFVRGRFTIAASKTFSLRHFCQAVKAVNGLGVESNSGYGVEVYAEVEFWKVA